MKKWFLIIIVLIVTPVLTSVVFATNIGMFEMPDCNIRIGNYAVKLQYPIYVNDDRIYVSLRSICDELGIPIKWDSKKNEAIMDIYNKKVPVSDKTLFREDGVIPDEQTALAVGKAILEKYADKPLEYETSDKIYYLEAMFDKQYNSWRVSQTFKYKDKDCGWSAGDDFYIPTVILNRQTGEVLYINTNSSFSD
jgi:hypothetical protein